MMALIKNSADRVHLSINYLGSFVRQEAYNTYAIQISLPRTAKWGLCVQKVPTRSREISADRYGVSEQYKPPLTRPTQKLTEKYKTGSGSGRLSLLYTRTRFIIWLGCAFGPYVWK